MAQFPIVRGSAVLRAKSPPLVRGLYPKLHANHRVENGGQGRNRTIDTRIFKTANCLFRLKKVEEI